MQPDTIESTRFLPVVVAATFNNAETLQPVLEHVRSLGVPLIVINDGSTDQTGQILADMRRSAAEANGLWVIDHPINRGKGAALRTAFAAAVHYGFTHALTIDTDGQHDPDQIPELLTVARHHPRALILGMRERHIPGYPLRSRAGRAISNFLLRLECQRIVQDTQCGLRVYPINVVQKLHCRTSRYGLETEILTRAAWAGVLFLQIPVRCRYLPDDERVSHFRPGVDSLRAVAMHSVLLMRAMPGWSGVFGRWISPRRAWRDLRREHSARGEFAAGVAIGVFIACLPAYGLQSVLGLLAARKFKLNPLSVLAGTQISMPPISLFLIALSLALGHLVLHGTLPHLEKWSVIKASLLSPAILRGWLVAWIIGGVLLGLVLACMVYALLRVMFHFVSKPECL